MRVFSSLENLRIIANVIGENIPDVVTLLPDLNNFVVERNDPLVGTQGLVKQRPVGSASSTCFPEGNTTLLLTVTAILLATNYFA